MKRITGFVIILIILFGLSGCGVLTMYSDKNPSGKVLYNGMERE